jgi:Photosynthetic reaction centre cytochrome C subunit
MIGAVHKTSRMAGGAGLLLITTLAICAQRVSTQTMLGRLGDAKLRVVMEEYNRALGVECAHCHVPDQWADESKPQFATARNMNRMVGELNDRLLRDIGTVSCWTCHRGQVRPSRLPRESLDAELTRWPVDLSNTPENTKLTMAVYAVTLGVGCDHCHDPADWKDASKRPMQMVSRMNAMFAEFPKFMPPTARTQCFMCHKGSTKPDFAKASSRQAEEESSGQLILSGCAVRLASCQKTTAAIAHDAPHAGHRPWRHDGAVLGCERLAPHATPLS